MTRHSHLDALAMTLMVVLCAIWGFQQVAIKVTNAGISPLMQAGLRSAGAVVLVGAWCMVRRVPLFDRDGTLWAGLVAGALFAGEFALLYAALDFTNASRAVVFLYTAPFFVALGVHLLVPGETLGRRQWLGLGCAFAGIVVAFGEGFAAAGIGGRALLGDLMALLAGALWGATTVVIKASPLARVRPAKTLLYQLGVSAALLPVASVLLGEPGIIALTPLVAASLAYQTLGVAALSYLAWFWLISSYPAARLSAFSFLAPLFGMLFGAAVLGEPLGPGLVAAMALVAGGIWLVNRPAPSARTAPAFPDRDPGP